MKISNPVATAAENDDPGGMENYDRYAEQLWITAFAKAPEITLFISGHYKENHSLRPGPMAKVKRASFDLVE